MLKNNLFYEYFILMNNFTLFKLYFFDYLKFKFKTV